jgi:hypothetical protein
LIEAAGDQGWHLHSSPYCQAETDKNIVKLGDDACRYWRNRLHPLLAFVPDCVVLDKPLAFNVPKDRPVLIAALAASCEVLLTLDRGDFGVFLGRSVYGMRVLTPGMFLMEKRS